MDNFWFALGLTAFAGLSAGIGRVAGFDLAGAMLLRCRKSMLVIREGIAACGAFRL